MGHMIIPTAKVLARCTTAPLLKAKKEKGTIYPETMFLPYKKALRK